MRLLAVSVLLFGLLTTANGECDGFRFASNYADHMVLQRAPSKTVIWGFAPREGYFVKVHIKDQMLTTRTFTSPEGSVVWEAHLDSMEVQSEPVTITAQLGGCSVELTDVLFGDVWVCSGQSNMFMPMKKIHDPWDDIQDAVNYPQVRTLQAKQIYSSTPFEELQETQQNWGPPTADRITEFSAVCWLYGLKLYQKYGRPIGLIQIAWGGSRIQAWSPPSALQVCFPNGVREQEGYQGESVLWNSLVHPLIKTPIYGVIWYQGEANKVDATAYGCAISNMIEMWRWYWYYKTGGQTDRMFPFGQVQLAPKTAENFEWSTPKVRWHQTHAIGYTPNTYLQNVFTAVALDLPDFESPHLPIHPRYKRPVVDRLVLGAYQLAYGDQSAGRYQGPFPTELRNADGMLTIKYDDGQPIEIRNKNLFEICCGNRDNFVCKYPDKWQPATIANESFQGHVVLGVPCQRNWYVTGVRYAWRESPCLFEDCGVYSIENSLPGPPYQFDRYIEEGETVNLSPMDPKEQEAINLSLMDPDEESKGPSPP